MKPSMIKNTALYLLLLVSLFSCTQHPSEGIETQSACLRTDLCTIQDSNLKNYLSHHYEAKTHEEIAASFNNIGKLFEEGGDYACALETLTEAKKIYQSRGVYKKQFQLQVNFPYLYTYQYDCNLSRDLASVYTNLAILYKDLENYDIAIDYARRATSIDSQCNISTLNDDYLNLGELYLRNSDIINAIKFTELAWSRIDSSDFMKMGIIENNQGNIYYSSKKFGLAIEKFNLSLSYHLNDPDLYCEAHIGIAKSYIDSSKMLPSQTQIASAITHLNEAYKMADEHEIKFRKLTSDELLGELYFDKGDSITAAKFLAEANDISNELYISKISRYVDIIKKDAEKEEENRIHNKEQQHKAVEFFWILSGLLFCIACIMSFSLYLSYNKHTHGNFLSFLFRKIGVTIKEFMLDSWKLIINYISGFSKRPKRNVLFFSLSIFITYELLIKLGEIIISTLGIEGIIPNFFIQLLIGIILVRFHHFVMHHIKFDKLFHENHQKIKEN